jgi:hypothetical protein
MPAWMLDSAASARMHAEVEPRVCIGALEGLRRLLDESRVLDAVLPLQDTGACEEKAPQTRRPDEFTATRTAPSGVEQPSGQVPQGCRGAAQRDAEAALPKRRNRRS